MTEQLSTLARQALAIVRVDADDVLRICLDPDGVLWFVRRDGMDCAPVVYFS